MEKIEIIDTVRTKRRAQACAGLSQKRYKNL